MKYIFHEEDQSGFFAEFGSFVHKILELYLSNELDKDEVALYYISNFDSEVTGKAPSRKMRYDFYLQGLNYLNSLSFPHKDIIATEKKIEFTINGHKYIGYLDVLSNESNGLIITDHKSRPLKAFSKNYPNKKTQSDIELETLLNQHYLYAWGIKQIYGSYPVQLEFNSFRERNFIVIPFDEKQMHKTLEWAERTRSDIVQNRIWTPTIEYWQCNHLCGVKNSCDFFRQCGGRALG